MTSLPPDALVAVIAVIVFLILVFWRIAIPVILAIIVAKVVVALAAIVPQGPPAATALALGAALVT